MIDSIKLNILISRIEIHYMKKPLGNSNLEKAAINKNYIGSFNL